MAATPDTPLVGHERATARFRAAFGGAGEAVLADLDGVVLVNVGPLASAITNVGVPFVDLPAGYRSTDLRTAIDDVRTEGSAVVTARIEAPDGTELTARVFSLRADEGTDRYIIATIGPAVGDEEIRRLQRADRLYEMLFERAPSGVALVAVDGRFIRANPAYCRLVGRSEAELLSMDFAQITHPDDLELDRSLAADVLAGRIDRYDIDKRYVRPDGSIVWVHLTVAVLRDDGGRAEHFISMVEDITERHHAAEQLRIALDVLQTTFEYTPVAMAELELDGTVVRANAAAGALIDLDPAELTGTRTVEILSPEEREDGLRNLARLVAGEVPAIHRERRIRDRTGRERWVSIHTAAVFGPNGTAERLIMQGIDITEASELRLQLEQSVEGLSHAFREKVGLMSALSHDLRAPLAAMRILAQMLAERPDQDEERHDLTRRLLAEAERTEAVLGDLVSSERAAAGLVVPRRSPVDLRKLVGRIVHDHREADRRFVLRWEAADPVVQGDAALLERMVDNLVANAVRHTTPSTTVWVGLVESEAIADAVELFVEDDGHGVPDELKAVIFEPYVRGHRSGRPGSGIGLFLVGQFADYHGGQAVCVDRPGGGARFVVTLPRSGRPQQEPAAS